MRLSLLLLLLAVASVPASSAQAPSPAGPAAKAPAGPGTAKAPAGNVAKGKEIYVSYGCFQCHNYAANGGGAGPKLAPNPIAYAAFLRQMREPRDQMPPYTVKVMTDQDVADIYAYLETVPPTPSLDSIPILKP